MRAAKLGGLEMPEPVEAVPTCPRCSKPGLRIVYGRLTFDGRRRAERGEYIAGGCMIEAASPRYGCTACRHAWGSMKDDPTMADDLRALEELAKTMKGTGT